jgi:hypothetical protein
MTYQSHYDIFSALKVVGLQPRWLGVSVTHNELVKQQNSNKRHFLQHVAEISCSISHPKSP